ncbi:unnamed protein product [Darwinula stevensoni]|uniref:Caspase family p20 domain-containing protein n=1 Tax=Darwinula stevensoni TaxID=69355 RepID=A0A7R8ZZU3_9CRUS|nr:unnamed protein product [Darwinula stevensoni]CAG0884433.1 unnamed protein product [Darwinula stevensoni]
MMFRICDESQIRFAWCLVESCQSPSLRPVFLSSRAGSGVDSPDGGGAISVPAKETSDPSEMKKNLDEFSKRPEHKHGDCCVVVIMSHGYQGSGSDPKTSSPFVISCSDGKTLQVEWIIQKFNTVESLKGKPKSRLLGHQIEIDFRAKLDWSYFAFGDEGMLGDESSMWLTAFAVKVLGRSRPFVFVDENEWLRNVRWIAEKQFPCFSGCLRLLLRSRVVPRASRAGVKDITFIGVHHKQTELQISELVLRIEHEDKENEKV